jgi:hypothetical protein
MVWVLLSLKIKMIASLITSSKFNFQAILSAIALA